jgi:hypothetical protein
MDTPYSHWETTPTLIDITEYTIDADTRLQIRLAPGGGQAISIVPEQE